MDELIRCECGRLWSFTCYPLLNPSPDAIDCKCGKVLKSWREAIYYVTELREDIPRAAHPSSGWTTHQNPQPTRQSRPNRTNGT